MKHHGASYVRRVERNLDLPWRQRRKLLRGLQAELRERFGELPDEETLLAEVGSPEEVAQALLLGVDEEDEARRRKARLLRIRCAAVLLGVLLAVSVGLICYFDITQVGRAKVTVTPDSTPRNIPWMGKINKNFWRLHHEKDSSLFAVRHGDVTRYGLADDACFCRGGPVRPASKIRRRILCCGDD